VRVKDERPVLARLTFVPPFLYCDVAVVVKKFGGKLLQNTERIGRIARMLVDAKKNGEDIVCVVSAMGDTTNNLLSLAREITPNPPIRELDMLLTAGERISIALLSMAVNSSGCEAISFTGSQSGIITDHHHTRARILKMTPYRIKEELKKGKIVVVAGFQGVSEAKEITTLGRGGSDITAVALSRCLGSSECELYKEVGGVYSVDPELVSNSRKIDTISYVEMFELAALGSGVVHPRAVEIAERYKILLRVRSLNGEVGTVIEEQPLIEETSVKGIAVDNRIVMLTLVGVSKSSGSVEQIVSILAEHSIPVRFFFHGVGERTCDLSFIIGEENCDSALSLINTFAEQLRFERTICSRDVGQVSVVGGGICSDGRVLSEIFSALAEEDTHIDAVYTSEARIALVIKREKIDTTVKSLAQKFGLVE
jgi:aspartate kinase